MTEGRSDSSPRSSGGGGGGSGGDNSSSPAVAVGLPTISADSPVKCGQIFGPFHDPLQWIAVKYTESTAPSPLDLQSLDRTTLELFRSVEIARNSNEQNLEIVLKGGQFYFKALQELESCPSRKLFAWFSEDLSDKLPAPLSQTLNGGKRYLCGLCSQVFINPNPVVVHILFSCSKRHEILPANIKMQQQQHLQQQAKSNGNNGNVQQQQQRDSGNGQIPPPPAVTATPAHSAVPKKRGFDIASLVEKDDCPPSEHKKRRQLELEERSRLISGSNHSPPRPQQQHHHNHQLHQQLSAHGHLALGIFDDSKSAFRTPLNPPARSGGGHPSLMSSLPSSLMSSLVSGSPLSAIANANHLNLPSGGGGGGSNSSSFPSAFKKVHKSPGDLLMSQSAGGGPSPSPFDLVSSLYGSGRGGLSSSRIGQSGLFPGQSPLSYQLMSPPSSSLHSGSLSSQTLPPVASQHQQQQQQQQQHSHHGSGHNSGGGGNSGHGSNGSSALSINSHSNSGCNNGNSTSNNNGKTTLIPPSLIPFLPPSLAALSFPQTNWCAKCNATFRMTSDLVYHMRSHHKMSGIADPVKKKREEKLRCNVCGESFRERHHLTRHMTSHQ